MGAGLIDDVTTHPATGVMVAEYVAWYDRLFGLNAARVFSVDVHATRNEIPKDYLSRIKTYLEDGATPSHR
jgi:hypothetical protein